MSFNRRGGRRGGDHGSRGDYRGRGSQGGSARGRGRGGGFGAREPVVGWESTIPLVKHDQALENKIVESSSSVEHVMKGLSISEKESGMTLAQRPSYGNLHAGTSKNYELFANFFPLSVSQTHEVPIWYKWDISVTENSDESKKTGRGNKSSDGPKGKKLKQIVKVFLQDKFPKELISHSIATEFKKFLFSTKELFKPMDKSKGLQTEESHIYMVKYRSEGEDKASEAAASFNVELKFIGKLSLKSFVRSLNGNPNQLPTGNDISSDRGDVLQALNIIMGFGAYLSNDLVYLGNSRAYAINGSFPESQTLRNKSLDMLRGYYQSVRPATGRLLLNVQVKAGAFHRPIKVSVLMMELDTMKWSDFEAHIRSVSVDMTYINIMNSKGQRIPRTKTIFGLARPTKPEGKGGKKAGRPVSIVMKYAANAQEVKFHNGSELVTVKQHFINIGHPLEWPDLPVINVGGKDNPVFIPPEHLLILPGQPFMPKLNGDATADLVRFAARKPNINIQSIVSKGLKILNFDPSNKTTQSFGITPEVKLVVVPARLLPPPIVRYGNSPAQAFEVSNGSWNLRDRTFNLTKVIQMKSFAVLTWTGRFQAKSNGIAEFAKQLIELGVIGPKVKYPPPYEISSEPRPDSDAWEHEVREKLTQIAKDGHGFVLVILPSGNKNDTRVYNVVKKICDVEVGLVNICVLSGNINNKFGSQLSEFCANVSMKVNLKLRGINHLTETRNLKNLDGTLMIGLDVTHPSPGSTSTAPSIAAIVGSIDNKFAQFPGKLEVFSGATEISRDPAELDRLQDLFSSRLKLWSSKNEGKTPNKILVFRDGVSEGQYSQLIQYELPQLKAACEQLCRSVGDKDLIKMPKITMFVVGKRHNTRFYPPKDIAPEFLSSTGNPKPCTVVDRGITEALTWDFYLIAQHAIQGTARPAHYVVVHDEIFTPMKKSGVNIADEVQQIILATHFSMGRATKAVSYCAPAYYADLLAERGRKYLWKELAPGNSSDSASTVSGSQSRESPQQKRQRILAHLQTLRRDIVLHQNVRDTMVYI